MSTINKMLLARVEHDLSLITLAPWYREAAFKVEITSTTHHPSTWAPVRFRIEYMEPDTVTGTPELQRGRWWYVEHDFSDEAIIKTAWAALTMSDEHRRREGFAFNGHRIFDPHKKVTIPGVNA